jgi:hypothetical protein
MFVSMTADKISRLLLLRPMWLPILT